MKNHIILDAGAVLDMAIAARAGHKAASALLSAIESNGIIASVCSSDLPAIYDEISDFMDSDAKLYLDAMLQAFDMMSVDEAVCKQALEVLDDNLSAAILQVCAEKAGVDYIITNDAGAYRKSNIKAIDAARYLQAAGA